MGYHVIKFFTDLQDGGHPYNVGDKYPRQGVTPKAERVTELASAANRQGEPLIKADPVVEEAPTPKVEKQEKPKAVVQSAEQKKRGRKAKKVEE